MKRLVLLSLLLAHPLLAGYAARDLVFPIVGRALAANGQTFLTSVWITNVATKPAAVTLTFLEAGHANPSPRTLQIEIAPGATRVLDPLDAPVGAMQVHANVDVIASARITGGDFTTSFAAIPARFAIGNRQSTVMQGYVSGAGQYKLYLAEITGEPLAYTVTVSDAAGNIRGEKRLYINRREELRLDLTAMFPATDGAVVKIAGTNGSGKIIALGLQRVPGSQDASAFEMSFPAPSPFALSWLEGTTYAAVAIAAIAAALIRR